MNKKQKKLLSKIGVGILLSLGVILLAGALLIFWIYHSDKRAFESKYNKAVAVCGGAPYVILSEIGDGSEISYNIEKASPSYHFRFISLDSFVAYECSVQQSKN